MRSSEAFPAVGLEVLVLCGVAGELGQHCLGALEVLPGALGTHVQAAEGVRGPAVEPRVEEVVRVRVAYLLVPVQTLPIQHSLRLHARRQLTTPQVVVHLEDGEEGDADEL